MTLDELINDIPLDVAIRAHIGTSHVPEQRGAQERAAYAATLGADHTRLFALADTEAKRAAFPAEFERYRQGYKTRFLAYLRSKGNCVSTMIAGPSGFNTRRAEKRSNVADKRGAELIEFRTRALAAIRKLLTPELQPIQLGDADAGDRIAGKLAKLEAEQAKMKAANAAIRKHAKAGPEAQVAALVAVGYPATVARELLQPDFAGRIGFPSYKLTNAGAEIRRLKVRASAVVRAHATPTVETAGADGVRVEDNATENRIRLFFPGKPDGAIRTRLKSAGFRWAPTIGCWQAYRNHNALETARTFTVAES